MRSAAFAAIVLADLNNGGKAMGVRNIGRRSRWSLAAGFVAATALGGGAVADEPQQLKLKVVGEANVEVASEAASIEAAEPAAEPDAKPEEDVVRPTHKQTLVIEVNSSDLPQATVSSFCLAPNGNLLVACGAEKGEIRTFSPDGKFVETWDLPVVPEAINVGSDGHVYVAGKGRLFRIGEEGKVLHEAESPHTAELMANKDQVRQQIIEQNEQRAKLFTTQLERYEKLIADLEEKQAKLEEEGEEFSKSDAQRLKSFKQMQTQFEKMAEQNQPEELNEEQIEERIQASIDYKLRVASISEADGEVFIATGAAAGYGFNVWRMNQDFEDGKVIVTELRGCCGQMDVQASKQGVYVAENSRHRVCHYDHEGELKTTWGAQARTGVNGFGSCCNPMNVAFGPEGSVYTAESETGRIKRFTPDGELIDMVGKVEIVPGCKKVSIGVDEKGDAVYMLDITRNHIVKMERLAPGETIAYFETRSETPAAAAPPAKAATRGVLRLFGIGAGS
jgi:sugar lactone lactonase YvrE